MGDGPWQASTSNCAPITERVEENLGISPETIALALDVDRRAVERWRASQSVPQGKTRERLGELVVLRGRLLGMFGTPEAAQAREPSEPVALSVFAPTSGG